MRQRRSCHRAGSETRAWRGVAARRSVACLAALSLALAAGAADLPHPLVFIYGAQDPEVIPLVADLGVNAVYVSPATLDSIEMARLEESIERAREHGLPVVIGIPTVSREFALMPAPGRERYRAWVTDVITRVVERFRDNEQVVAWAAGDFLEDAIDYNEADFRAYLREQYGQVASLNAWWGTGLRDWGEASRALARELDDGLPFHVGRASVDVADFMRWAFHAVMQHWAQEIKALDPARPLMTGRISLYRDLAAVPAEYDVVCPFISPLVGDPDQLTHNVHAVDMARRGGRFEVVPCLETPVTEEQHRTRALARWTALAAVHGARGIGLADWRRIEEAPAQRVTLQALEETLAGMDPEEAFSCRPAPTVAFLHQPYAAGFRRGEQGVYGYLGDFSHGQPNNPFWAFRLGMRYGLADYLTLDDLPLTDLDRYGVVFAPLALRLPVPAQAQLVNFVQGGGALVCDVGTGMVETGSWMALPPAMARLLGVRRLVEGREMVGDLRIGWAPPWLPNLPRGARTLGSHRTSRQAPDRVTAAERRGYHVAGFVCHAEPAEGAGLIAVSSTAYVDRRQVFAGLVGNRTGLGATVFATHRLWANWTTADPAYEAFHHDLCARRPAVELLDAPFWTTGICATATEEGVSVANARPGAETAEVISYEAGHALHTDATGTYSALARRPDGLRSGAARLTVDLPPLSVVHTRRLPVLIQPLTGTCVARLVELAPERLVMELAGGGAEVRVTIADGPYRVPPGSVHRITITGERQKVIEGEVTAGPDGQLRFSEAIGEAVVRVERQADGRPQAG